MKTMATGVSRTEKWDGPLACRKVEDRPEAHPRIAGQLQFVGFPELLGSIARVAPLFEVLLQFLGFPELHVRL
jgi:hypothetical protein